MSAHFESLGQCLSPRREKCKIAIVRLHLLMEFSMMRKKRLQKITALHPGFKIIVWCFLVRCPFDRAATIIVNYS